jgi:hypothetical protein
MKATLVASAGASALVIALTAAAALGASHTSTNGPCTPGTPTIHGHPAIAFCGPATATVRAGGKTYIFKHGFCAKDPKNSLALQLSLGVSVPVFGGEGPTNAGQPYFSITIGTNHAVAFAAAAAVGKQVVPKSAITVAGKIPAKGMFTGTRTHFTGAWNCNGVIYTTSNKKVGA